MKKILSISLITIILCLCLCSCGNSKYVGVYNSTETTWYLWAYDDMFSPVIYDIPNEIVAETLELNKGGDGYVEFVFKTQYNQDLVNALSDSSDFSYKGYEKERSGKITWSVKDDYLYITFPDGHTTSYVLKGNELYTTNGDTLWYKKVK